MNREKIVQLKQGLTTAFINQNSLYQIIIEKEEKLFHPSRMNFCHAKNLQLALHLLLWEGLHRFFRL